MISIFNTMSMSKESFEPFNGPRAGIFICGPTVYDYSHVGHARLFTVYDVIARHLRARGYEPFVLVNLTDVDPKVLKRAKSEETNFRAVAEKFTTELQKDLEMLGVQTINSFALTSDYVEQAKANIGALLKDGFAYTASGNVYFDTGRMPDYGRLSHQSVDEMRLRPIDLAPGKAAKHDFLIWNGRHHLGVSWESDFGQGIPWWHIQDSTIALANLDSRYEIHGGARELLYPHHEAHLAQMKALTRHNRPVKYWTHTGIVSVDGAKMSKSLGNVVRTRDAVRKYGSDTLRICVLARHYREDLVFSEDLLAKCGEDVRLLRGVLGELDDAKDDELDNEAKHLIDDFYRSMDDDFDTASAINALLSLCKDITTRRIRPSGKLKDNIHAMIGVLGLRPA